MRFRMLQEVGSSLSTSVASHCAVLTAGMCSISFGTHFEDVGSQNDEEVFWGRMWTCTIGLGVAECGSSPSSIEITLRCPARDGSMSPRRYVVRV